MARVWGTLTIAASACFITTYVLAEDAVPDLSAVEGIQYFDGPESAKALLKQNGFVVLPTFSRQIFEPCENKGLPHCATVDSIHSTFHALFEDELKGVETTCATDVLELTRQFIVAVDGDRFILSGPSLCLFDRLT